ncbi:MAG: response regulator transcription factor [Dehalococcoidales bacterium]|nr:response regulator transcription factor [Dehalococcoidales bacterium]
MEKITVFLAEDHAVVREGLGELIRREADMEVVGEAGDGEDTVRQVKELGPDIVLMDIAMPGMNGIEATKQIKEVAPHSRILVLTAYDNPEFVTAVIDAGAAGYLLKNVRGKELTNAIRSAYEGESVLHPAVAKSIFARLHVPSAKSLREKPDVLSERELQVLQKGAEGLSNKQIAVLLSIGSRTVQTHWRNIFDKLGVYSRTEAIVYCLKKGWLNLSGEGNYRDGTPGGGIT